jgi:hypothetical protein
MGAAHLRFTNCWMQVGYPPLMQVDTFRDMAAQHEPPGTAKGMRMSIVTRTIAIALVSAIAAREAELVLEETCDGWRARRTALNVSSLKPQTWQEVIFPICWGRHHHDCRSTPASRSKVTSDDLQPLFSVTYRADCRDKATGASRAASTVTVSASTRQAAVDEIERMIRTNDVCQGNGDLSRIAVPGSGRYLD